MKIYLTDNLNLTYIHKSDVTKYLKCCRLSLLPNLHSLKQGTIIHQSLQTCNQKQSEEDCHYFFL